MRVIALTGHLGPLDALTLRRSLEAATASERPNVFVDLSGVESMHPAVAAALIHAARQARSAAGDLRLVHPTSPGADRVFRFGAIAHLVCS